jgi:hypothetical protein
MLRKEIRSVGNLGSVQIASVPAVITEISTSNF